MTANQGSNVLELGEAGAEAFFEEVMMVQFFSLSILTAAKRL